MQVQHTCSSETPGHHLERQEQEIECLYRRQLTEVGDLDAKAPHLAVQQALVRVRIARKNQDLHRATSSARTPAPKVRFFRTPTAPSERLRQAGMSSRAG